MDWGAVWTGVGPLVGVVVGGVITLRTTVWQVKKQQETARRDAWYDEVMAVGEQAAEAVRRYNDIGQSFEGAPAFLREMMRLTHSCMLHGQDELTAPLGELARTASLPAGKQETVVAIDEKISDVIEAARGLAVKGPPRR